MRSEDTIFRELAALCVSKGFVHAIATICFRDTVVAFSDELKTEDMASRAHPSCLVRTEITTLIGLMMRGPIDFSLPDQQPLSGYIEKAEALLEELHHTMLPPSPVRPGSDSKSTSAGDEFTFGKFLREAIFYSGESAYPFQYRDLAPRKYASDSNWLLENKGIDLEVGRRVCGSLADILNERLLQTLNDLKDRPLAQWTMLPAFVFSCSEIASNIDKPISDIRAFVDAFTLPNDESNSHFCSLNAFNAAYAYPIIRKNSDEFVLFQYYGISEAFYETPFYWLFADQNYSDIALQHRGEFTEDFAEERLSRVFGRNQVFRNVEIERAKGKTLGEIDVLAIFGNRAIVLQAKSKKLTMEARKGNDQLLRNDFRKAVQDAVDQSFACAQLLFDSSIRLRSKNGRTVPMMGDLRTVFPIAIVSDHYPALAFQARHLLKVNSSDQIVAPLVTDVFAIDAISEMLESPLRFLSYLSFRARHGHKLMANHEHMLLSYHLKNNLWVEENVDILQLADDVSTDLDIAMAVRRDGVPGRATPDGILTRMEGTPFASIIGEIENSSDTVAIDLGLMLLELGENTVHEINGYVREILKRAAVDGRFHNMSISIAGGSTGLTIHCGRPGSAGIEAMLRHHCEVRKYDQRAKKWFGLALNAKGSILVAVEVDGVWQYDHELEMLARRWKSSSSEKRERFKMGRNALCFCGSGKKYKHCCMRR